MAAEATAAMAVAAEAPRPAETAAGQAAAEMETAAEEMAKG